MPETTLSEADKQQLMQIAKQSVHEGLQHGRPLQVDPTQYSGTLSSDGASFVTLHINSDLRGCIGSLEAHRPLVSDVAQNAFNAAFRDPRFPPLRPDEAATLHFHISVLSKPVPMEFRDEQDLLDQIRPGIDGLVLEDGFNRGTFLPSVWEQLPSKTMFLAHLKQKAGLPSDYWSSTLKVERYTVDDINETAP